MDTRLTLIADIDAFCTEHGCSVSAFGKNAANDAKIIPRLRRGGDITLATYDRIRAWMAGEEHRIAQAQLADVESRASTGAPGQSQKAMPSVCLDVIEAF